MFFLETENVNISSISLRVEIETLNFLSFTLTIRQM